MYSIQTALRQAYLCNLLEDKEQELMVEDNTISFEIKPFEIVTLKLEQKLVLQCSVVIRKFA